jgi:diguanylate cyclase (GGDEF)-like protein/putative nucleotidyltransferase with HDIG domain
VIEKHRVQIRLDVLTYTVIGTLAGIAMVSQVRVHNPLDVFIFLVCAILVSVGSPVAAGERSLPAGLLVLLVGVERLSAPELLFIALTITLLCEVQQTRHALRGLSLLYELASATIGIVTAQATYRLAAPLWHSALFPAPLIASSFVLLFNHGLATMLLREAAKPYARLYRRECRPLLPWFIAAAYLADLVECASQYTGYHPGLLALPIMLVLKRGYWAWADARTAQQKELTALHQNTLETLSLAIDTRDHTTKSHLRRVQIYAVAIGKEMGLGELESEALKVAALLHDIGKLAIPDHILLKPGSLTEEEWEKMKTHAEIGAAMLERMNFPDSILAIVRAHHEKWDGTGYPNGRCREEIPIGARILSAVDCLDALASDRPYRSALPLREAMDMVKAEAGRSFDPKIVCLLERKFSELEKQALQAVKTDSDDRSGAAVLSCQAGLQQLATSLRAESDAASIADGIAFARQETQILQELTNDLAHSECIEEAVASVHKRLSQIVSYDTVAVYVRRQENLEPVGIAGAHAQLFSRQPFPISKGLSGWVAQHRSPILNGTASHECGYSNDSNVIYNLQAALAVPFEGRSGIAGVLTLYHLDRNAFSRDHLRILQAVSLNLGPAIESALRFKDAEESAVTDHLTGIPNARSLAVHLERELARASREHSTIGVLVCDLDGFKQVNDRFGHLKGNEVLQNVANGLRAACRTSDYLARMGGDEFVITVPGLNEENSSSYVSRLRSVALDAGWIVCGERCLSLSVGVAIYPHHGTASAALLSQADSRMYLDKQERKSAMRSDVSGLDGTGDTGLSYLESRSSADLEHQKTNCCVESQAV